MCFIWVRMFEIFKQKSPWTPRQGEHLWVSLQRDLSEQQRGRGVVEVGRFPVLWMIQTFWEKHFEKPHVPRVTCLSLVLREMLCGVSKTCDILDSGWKLRGCYVVFLCCHRRFESSCTAVAVFLHILCSVQMKVPDIRQTFLLGISNESKVPTSQLCLW